MKIVDSICGPVRTGFNRDDQAAIRAGAAQHGFLYEARPRTTEFQAFRQPGAAVSVMLVLSDRRSALVDCAEVHYSGAGGQASVFSLVDAPSEIRGHGLPMARRPVLHRIPRARAEGRCAPGGRPAGRWGRRFDTAWPKRSGTRPLSRRESPWLRSFSGSVRPASTSCLRQPAPDVEGGIAHQAC